MDKLISQIEIRVNDKIYLKDPNSSDLGKSIVSKSILLIDQIGLEGFTFRKLAKELGSTESSIYRYFESKHKLLIYLTSWYWGWLQYQFVFSTTNIVSPVERLRAGIRSVTKQRKEGETFGHIDLHILNRIVISESSKTYHTIEVDEANREGFYAGYKSLVERLSTIVLEINPKFKYSHTLISTIIEGIHHQKYFAEHLPSLTDIKSDSSDLAEFYFEMAISVINKKKNQ